MRQSRGSNERLDKANLIEEVNDEGISRRGFPIALSSAPTPGNGGHMSRHRFRPSRRALLARKNRQEIIRAGLSRREMCALGLLTSGGLLVPKRGLSSRFDDPLPSPPTTPFRDDFPLTLPPVKRPVSTVGNTALLSGPTPTVAPNVTINPATGLAF